MTRRRISINLFILAVLIGGVMAIFDHANPSKTNTEWTTINGITL